MCGLEETLEQASAHFRLLIAFVLGGFVAGTVGMWRRRRQNYASLCGSARNLTVQIQALLPLEEGAAGGEATKLRETLSRWVILAYELAVLPASSSCLYPPDLCMIRGGLGGALIAPRRLCRSLC